MSRAGGVLLALWLAFAGGGAAEAADEAAATPAATAYERGEFRFTVAPVPAFVKPQDVPDAWDAGLGSPDDRWRNWLLDRQVDRRPGQDIEYYEHAVQPMTPELVDEAARFSIGFNPAFQTLALHRVELRRDGQWLDRLDTAQITLARRESGFEADVTDGEVTALVVLSDVRAGDVVRLAYSVRGTNPILAGDVDDNFHLAWVDPVLRKHGLVVFAPDTKVGVRRWLTDLPVTQQRRADRLDVELAARDVPAVRDLGAYPVWYSPYPQVQIARERTWAEVVAWALPLYPAPTALPDDLAARVAAWKAIPDRSRQVMAVLTAMQEEIRYFGIEMGDSTHRPAAPADTWRRRFGDCKDKAWLMVTVLRELGLQAEPALVSAASGKAVAGRVPSASAFDHVIVRLHLDGREYWLDPTLTQQRGTLAALDVDDYGVALPLAPGVTDLAPVRANGTPGNAISVVERIVPADDGKALDLYVETRYVGQRAEAMRRRLRSERLQDVGTRFEDYYRKQYGPLTVAAPVALREDEAANSVALSEHYRLVAGWSDSGVSSRSLDLFADALQADAAMPESLTRSEPIVLASPSRLSHEIRIELPEGWALDEAPETLAVQGGVVDYERKLAQSGRAVTLTHRLDIRKGEAVGAEVGEYLAKIREIHDALGRRVRLRLPPDAGRSERDRRLRALLQDVMQDGGVDPAGDDKQ
jgi:hypothetical protein